MNKKEFLQINPNSTIVKGITHDADKRLVTIEFDVFEELSFWARLNTEGILYIIILVNILGALFCGIYKQKKEATRIASLADNVQSLELAVQSNLSARGSIVESDLFGGEPSGFDLNPGGVVSTEPHGSGGSIGGTSRFGIPRVDGSATSFFSRKGA